MRRVGEHLGVALGAVLLAAAVLGGTLSVEAALLAAWLENVSVGVATAVALARVPGGVPLAPTTRVEGLPVRTGPDGVRRVPSGCAAGFFAAHFGLFTLVHGVFLAAVVLASTLRGEGAGGWSLPALAVVAISALLRALRPVEPRRAVAQAYAGLVPVHVAVIAVVALAGDRVAADGRARPVALAVVGLLVVGDVVRARIGARTSPGPA